MQVSFLKSPGHPFGPGSGMNKFNTLISYSLPGGESTRARRLHCRFFNLNTFLLTRCRLLITRIQYETNYFSHRPSSLFRVPGYTDIYSADRHKRILDGSRVWASDWDTAAYPIQAYVADFRHKALTH